MPSYTVVLNLEDDREDIDQVFDSLEGLLWSVLPEAELSMVSYA